MDNMRVGYIVKTRPHNVPISEHEYEKGGYIFSNRPSDTLKSGESLCVAQRIPRAPPLVRMREVELAKCDGAETQDSFNEAWVAVGALIFNMTNKFAYPPRIGTWR